MSNIQPTFIGPSTYPCRIFSLIFHDFCILFFYFLLLGKISSINHPFIKMFTNNPINSQCRPIAICGRDAILRSDGSPLTPSDFAALLASLSVDDHFEEKETNIHVLSFKTADGLSSDYLLTPIRQLFADLPDDEVLLYARARAIATWRANTRFCGRCGSPLNEHPELSARLCPACSNLIFPRIEPCIIVAVRKNGKILLARHVQRNQDIYACIAGFMEAGESAEHAVQREIFEEVGIKVKNIRYFGSQSWPFPAQLMLGFTADYDSGDINLQKDEISDAQWFDPDSCQASPRPGSIAYRLIHSHF